MLTLLGIIAVVIWAGQRYGDAIGEIGLAVVVVMVVGMLVSAAGKDARAYRNRVEYWAKGGPDRGKKEET